jgi:hypothetical protein
MLARFRDQPKLVSGSAAAVCELRGGGDRAEITYHLQVLSPRLDGSQLRRVRVKQ